MGSLIQLEDLVKLQKLLRDESTPFLHIVRKVTQNFSNEQLFSVCSVLTIMLRDELLTVEERIVALFILLHLSPLGSELTTGEQQQPQKQNQNNKNSQSPPVVLPPFLPVLLNIAQNNQKFNETQFEALFVTIGLNDPNSDLFKLRPNQIGVNNIERLKKYFPESSKLNLQAIFTKFSQIESKIPLVNKLGIGTSISDPEKGKESKKNVQDFIQNQLNTDEFKPPFVRPSPSILQILDNELIWIDYEDETLLPIWDQTITNVKSNNDQFKNLMKKAFTSQLSQLEQQQIILRLENEPKLLGEGVITPNNFQDLVEKNPIISFEILKRFSEDEEKINIYLESFIKTNVTLHSMEVINKLSGARKKLNKDFLNRFVSNCISSCSEITDKYVQGRHVRLVCAFIRSLMNNSQLDVKNVFSKLQSFCVEFSRIRDASNLFRLIKNQMK
ncbi:ccr4-not transcription complex subunit 11 [Anaeramoeba flamelloides]|uniref:CCR4-NOT transcription complex subunit 11 n=1 Tax=Anaeramoeba flamelloides TaxID=1746091 RepID=A0ABQ8Z4P7_9EUKA|nr:ccr4-not transcription complex subunit 11 [Anaeramoeba flamelloides]